MFLFYKRRIVALFLDGESPFCYRSFVSMQCAQSAILIYHVCRLSVCLPVRPIPKGRGAIVPTFWDLLYMHGREKQ